MVDDKEEYSMLTTCMRVKKSILLHTYHLVEDWKKDFTCDHILNDNNANIDLKAIACIDLHGASNIFNYIIYSLNGIKIKLECTISNTKNNKKRIILCNLTKSKEYINFINL